MDPIGWAMIGVFVVLVVGAIAYALIRLSRQSHEDVNPKVKRLARIVLLPPIFDPLVAKPLLLRELIGLLFLVLILVLAIAFF
jgi:hypothetical protein